MHQHSGSRVVTAADRRDTGPPGRTAPRRRGGPRAAVLAVVLVWLVVLAVAPAAPAGISDDIIAPSWTHTEIGFGASEDHADAVALAGGGVTYVAGWAGNATGNDDITLAKYVDGATDPTWGGKRIWDGANHNLDQAHGVATGSSGAVYTVGTTFIPGCRAVVVKWSAATGEVLWARYYGRTGLTVWGENIAVDRRGNVVVAGTCEVDGKRDWYAVSWSPSGKRRWTWRPGALTPGDTDCYLAGLALARDGTVYLAGRQTDDKQVLTVKLSRLGARVWSRSYRGPGSAGATVLDAAVRPGGGVYWCGSVPRDPSGRSGLVVGYAPTGVRKVFALDVDGDSVAFTEVAVTSNGSVVAAGIVGSGWDYPHYALYKPGGTITRSETLSAGSVKRMWTGVAADTFGGFYLTACTNDAGGNGRIQTQRFPTTLGGGTWTGFYQPYPAMEWTEPNAIAVRGSTVVVVGYTDTGGPSGEDQVAVGYTY
jgi:hypothetical protein